MSSKKLKYQVSYQAIGTGAATCCTCRNFVAGSSRTRGAVDSCTVVDGRIDGDGTCKSYQSLASTIAVTRDELLSGPPCECPVCGRIHRSLRSAAVASGARSRVPEQASQIIDDLPKLLQLADVELAPASDLYQSLHAHVGRVRNLLTKE